jgi:hypothetical protein
LQTAFEMPRVPLQHVRLDLRILTYVDPAGVRLLEGLIAQGAKVIGCSGFVAELLGIDVLMLSSQPVTDVPHPGSHFSQS